MAAVRVPPSAWSTSQSMMIWRSPRSSSAVTARSERPIRRWISWVRPRLLAGGRFAPRALGGGARQHAVFRRHPAAAAAAQEGRRLVLEARGAQHMGIAEFHQAGAFGMFHDPGSRVTGRISSCWRPEGLKAGRIGDSLEVPGRGLYLPTGRALCKWRAPLVWRPVLAKPNLSNTLAHRDEHREQKRKIRQRPDHQRIGRPPARSVPPSGRGLSDAGRAGGIAHAVAAPAADLVAGLHPQRHVRPGAIGPALCARTPAPAGFRPKRACGCSSTACWRSAI